jgi:hypothetical protein
MMPKAQQNDSALQAYVQRSRSLQRRAWWFTIVPLAIFVLLLGAVAHKTVQLRELQTATAEAEKTLAKDRAEISQLETRLQILGNTVNILSTTAKVPPEQTAAAFNQAASQFSYTALITIQVAYDSQLGKAKQIANSLRHLGYEVPPDQGIEVRGKARISRGTYLRFFVPSDKVLAQQIVDQINAIQIGVKVEPFDLSDEPASSLGEIHPRQFELRLGSDYHPEGEQSNKSGVQ